MTNKTKDPNNSPNEDSMNKANRKTDAVKRLPEWTSQKEKGNSAEKTNCCGCFCFNLPIILLIICSLLAAIFLSICLSLNPYKSYSSDDETSLNQILRNWRRSPIIGIRGDMTGCQEYLTFYEFPGTINGCDCRLVLRSRFDPVIFPFECTAEMTWYNCRAINSTPSREFTSWRVEDNVFQLCVDRIPNFTFLDQDCDDENQKECFLNADESESAFCQPKELECPIRSLKFGDESPGDDFASILKLNNNQEFFISREPIGEQPIAFGLISTGSLVCTDHENLRFIDSNIVTYVLNRGRNETCFSQTDNSFQEVTSITEELLLRANNHFDLISSLPQYSFDPPQYYTLNTRGFQPWKHTQECKGYLNKLRSYNPSDYSLKTDPNFQVILAAMIISWVVFVLFGLLATCLRLLYGWKIKNLMIIFTIILLAAQLGIVIALLVLIIINSDDDPFSGIGSANCSDNDTNQILSKFERKQTQLILVILALIALVLMVIIASIWWKRIFRCQNFCCGCCLCNSELTQEQIEEQRRKEEILNEKRNELLIKMKEQDEMLEKMELKNKTGDFHVDIQKSKQGGFRNIFKLTEQQINEDEEAQQLLELVSSKNKQSINVQQSQLNNLSLKQGEDNQEQQLQSTFKHYQATDQNEEDPNHFVQESALIRPVAQSQYNFRKLQSRRSPTGAELLNRSIQSQDQWRNYDLIQDKQLREPLQENRQGSRFQLTLSSGSENIYNSQVVVGGYDNVNQIISPFGDQTNLISSNMPSPYVVQRSPPRKLSLNRDQSQIQYSAFLGPRFDQMTVKNNSSIIRPSAREESNNSPSNLQASQSYYSELPRGTHRDMQLSSQPNPGNNRRNHKRMSKTLFSDVQSENSEFQLQDEQPIQSKKKRQPSLQQQKKKK